MKLQLLALSSTSLAAFSAEQISFVFQSTKALKGASFRAPAAFDFTLVANSTHALCSLQLIDGGKPGASSTDAGWIGIGGGPSMIGSDDLVFWQSKGEWVVSRRQPDVNTLTQMKDPGDAGASSDVALVPELSSSKGSKVVQVSFVRKLAPSYKSESAFKNWKLAKNQPFVFARSSMAPDGDADSPIAFHDVGHGQFTLDLSKNIKATRQFGAGSVLSVKLPAAVVEKTTEAKPTTKARSSSSSSKAETMSKSKAIQVTKTIENNREAHTKKNATLTSSAYDPNDTPDFCDLLAAKNATESGPCAQRTGETTRKPSSAALEALPTTSTTSAPDADESLASAVAAQDFSSASSLQLSMVLMIIPLCALLLS